MLEIRLKKTIEGALLRAKEGGLLALQNMPDFTIERPKFEGHGDLATNVAMMLSKPEKKAPRDIAQIIVSQIQDDILESIEIAGPGFINFTLKTSVYIEELKELFKGFKIDIPKIIGTKKKKYQVEFVSANPTGPLHIGHGRGAVFGDTLANILKAAGHYVEKEYYVNDAGNQMNTLGKSVYLRIKERSGEKIEFPEDCYQGEYISDIAQELIDTKKAQGYMDMGEDKAIYELGQHAANLILKEIKIDLEDCGIVHDHYFHEKTLHPKPIEKSLKFLNKKNHTFEKDGALWFKTTDFGDDKDRVLRKQDGALTYLAADVAYHKEKFDRGFDKVIDIWGADHAGYVARMKAVASALGHDPDDLQTILIQLVNLIKGGELVSMSTRRATYETLKDVVDEVGKDVCRYFFLMRSHNAQLDFDLELAKTQSSENPVYYIQYANARIHSVFSKAGKAGFKPKFKDVDHSLLNLPEEKELAKFILEYPKVIADCASTLEPHKLAFYLLELAKKFQGYYTKGRSDDRYRFINENAKITESKLYLLKNIQVVLRHALDVLGISAPERMEKSQN